MKCGKTKYTVGTGNSQGSCVTNATPTTPATSVKCDDGRGNTSEATCLSGCIRTNGSGDCKSTTEKE
jgi:hypothetical protein